jgi:hypothetical protein
MTQVYFHCSTNTNEVLVDRCGAVVDDLAEARDHAASVVRSLTKARSLEYWRGWIVHVNDDLGDELFVVPFAFALGLPIARLHRCVVAAADRPRREGRALERQASSRHASYLPRSRQIGGRRPRDSRTIECRSDLNSQFRPTRRAGAQERAGGQSSMIV